MAWGYRSQEFRILADYWRDYIIEKIQDHLDNLEEEYEEYTSEEREEIKAYNTLDYDAFCFHEYDLHHEVFNLDQLFWGEDDCIRAIKSSKEMLYLLQYTEKRQTDEGDNTFVVNDMTTIMNKFCYFMSRDLMSNEDVYTVQPILSFIQKMEEKRIERKLLVMLMCKYTDKFDGNIEATILSFMN
jgi:CRISPR/Cas system CMR-associated protein Cmr1 (group 7 of RAMP superfamily)